MRFYTKQHRHYCGVDLHARTMYLCILDQAGEVLLFFVRKRGELLAHIQNTNTQHNLPGFERRIDRPENRSGLIEHFDQESVQLSIAADMALLDAYDNTIRELELYLIQRIRKDANALFYLLRSVPGIGEILSMTLLYEIHDINRFPRVQEFLSYARLVKGTRESAGKKKSSGGRKIGNAHLKWAFSEAAVLFLRANPIGQKYLARLEKKHGRAKALSVLAAKLGRAVYYMLRRHKPFELKRFVIV